MLINCHFIGYYTLKSSCTKLIPAIYLFRDDLLEGDLDVSAFGDLDAEEEDALLADEDYDLFKVGYISILTCFKFITSNSFKFY